MKIHRTSTTLAPGSDDSAQRAPSIRLDHVTVTDPSDRPLLDDISLDVSAGQTLGIVGASGAGKSTIIRLLTGDPLPQLRTTGSVRVDGVELGSLTSRKRRDYRRTQLGVVHQNPGGSLNPTQRVASAILELVPRPDRSRATASRLLDEVGLPIDRPFLNRRTHQLSGGQRQRLAIARTLAHRPRVILLDEPTAELDHPTRDLVVELLAERTQNTTTVLVAHDSDVIDALSNKVVTLNDGVLGRPTKTYIVPPRQRATDRATTRPASGLEINGLTTSHPAVRGNRLKVIDDFTLDVNLGEIVAITGPSGVGKTTLARAIAGLHPPDAGTIALHGHPLPPTIDQRSRAQRRSVQLVPQDPTTTLPPTTRILDIVARPATRLRQLDNANAQCEASTLLKAVNLSSRIHERRPHTLSGGERQRVAIARALAAQPDLLICDEITSALDPSNTRMLIELLAELRERHDLTLLVITHDPDVAKQLADRTIPMFAAGQSRASPEPGETPSWTSWP